MSHLRKRGRVKLSTIVIIILTLCLLAVSFTLKICYDENKILEKELVEMKIKQQLLDDLMISDKKINMVNDYVLPLNAEEEIFLGVKNTNNKTLRFKIRIFDLNNDSVACTHNPNHEYLKPTKYNPNCTQFSWEDYEQELTPQQSKIYSIYIHSPDKVGVYLYKIVLWNYENNKEYASKSLYVTTK